MTNLHDQFRDYCKLLFRDIDYLTYDERKELLSFMQYYINLCIKRKFEHNFNIN